MKSLLEVLERVLGINVPFDEYAKKYLDKALRKNIRKVDIYINWDSVFGTAYVESAPQLFRSNYPTDILYSVKEDDLFKNVAYSKDALKKFLIDNACEKGLEFARTLKQSGIATRINGRALDEIENDQS